MFGNINSTAITSYTCHLLQMSTEICDVKDYFLMIGSSVTYSADNRTPLTFSAS